MLSAAFLRDVTENIALAARTAPLAGCVAYAPAGEEALFEGVLAPGTPLILADGSPIMPAGVNGLGHSLLHATRRLLAAGHSAACLLNADSPTLPTHFLRQAEAALAMPGERAVLGPAEDGGYYLLGMKAAHAHLFQDIDWSTERVAEQTRARARALGLELIELPPWYDVDDIASRRRLAGEFQRTAAGSAAPYPAPATAACFRRLGLESLLAEQA